MSKVAEKKLINDKIAKVREVVHGVSTNDIILALHSFDMNVERTIQAFCEDGASEVLDDWVRPTGASGKNKNKKKKKNKQCGSESEAGSVAPTASPSVVPKTSPNYFVVISTQGASAPAAVSLPKAVSPVQAAAIKHATSQSSISSSLGADSGVNLSPTHNAKVVSGGIQMQSDVLSADQLEALQRSLAEQLAAFGIDASVLSGVTAGDMPVRRNRKLDATRKGPVQYRNEKSSIRPQLSIL
ncbi:unnamed protein product [Angiostrongylus costaricensis]|uniref:Nbl1_Borealin_N domain-containing protein n=1 Tax=Angiostrongylus costaricensis TaxID=334426 RepID=A0A0R3PC38_ANGCS|nr:unnamed protein product [Angiostrongylus costaricensis]